MVLRGSEGSRGEEACGVEDPESLEGVDTKMDVGRLESKFLWTEVSVTPLLPVPSDVYRNNDRRAGPPAPDCFCRQIPEEGSGYESSRGGVSEGQVRKIGVDGSRRRKDVSLQTSPRSV